MPNQGSPDGDISRLAGTLQKVPRLLVLRLRSLGDSILALPLIEALKAWRPDLDIDVLVESPYAAVFSLHPAVHETLVLQPRRGEPGQGRSRFRACIDVFRRRYPAILNLHGGTTSLFLTLASASRVRIGQQKYRCGWAYNYRIPAPPTVWHREDLHTVEDQLTLLPWLGLPVPPHPRGQLHLSDSARARIRERLTESGMQPAAFLLIQPTATQSTKQWPEDRFASLADRLHERYSLPVVFSSAPREAQILLNIGRQARHRHHYWSDLGLEDLFALIAASRLFVGNDSGPTHAAAALGKPLVVVWGSSDFRAWHPWETVYECARMDFPCMPCPGHTCAAFGEPRCIRDIDVAVVTAACERFLQI